MARALPLFAVALLAGCSTVDSRIRKSQKDFDAYPPEVQQRIRKKQVDVGFSQQQVFLALGKPDRKYTRRSADENLEVWAYTDSSGVGIGLGLGTVFGGHGGVYGGGVSVGTGSDYHDDERVRVVFKDGRVVSIDQRQR